MDYDALLRECSATPRKPELAANLNAQYRKVWFALIGTVVGSFIFGAPFSLIRFRSSRPWEPTDILVAGIIIAIFTVPIATVAVVLFSKYRRLFMSGRLVEATVMQQRPNGSVLKVAVGVGPDLTFIPNLAAPVGQRFPAVIGDAMSSLVLVVVQRGVVARGSLLTEQMLTQVPGAP